MNCAILETLYVRSNGDIPCHDDLGERILLGRVEHTASGWSVVSVVTNDRYRHIRDSLAAGRPPWPDTCPGCAWFRRDEPLRDGLGTRRIRVLQVEPSLACNMRCPCCSNGIQIRTRPRPFVMPVAAFDTLLQSLSDEDYAVSEIEYCGQGEPLMHPEFAAFARTARARFPKARQRLITNGNFEYDRAVGDVFLDEIYVSCDGYFQDSYVQYRRGGDVQEALAFMRDVPREVDGQKRTLVWKYILFEFNDSDEELIAAQHAAESLGVDVLLFVFTHSRYKSQRYTPETAAMLPIVASNVMTNATPLLGRDARPGRSVGSRTLGLRRTPADLMCVVDEVLMLPRSHLALRGWAWAATPITAIDVAVDGQPVGSARLGLPRPDVVRAFPAHADPWSGFAFGGRVSETAAGRRRVTLTFAARAHLLGSFDMIVDFDS